MQTNTKFMSKISLKILFFTGCTFFYLILGTGDAGALNLQINNNKISIHANNIPLQKILERMTALGVTIYLDPEINPNITASFENRDGGFYHTWRACQKVKRDLGNRPLIFDTHYTEIDKGYVDD